MTEAKSFLDICPISVISPFLGHYEASLGKE